MPLRLTVKGATKEELARGIAAAEDFLMMNGVTPAQAADGMFALYCKYHEGYPEDDLYLREREQRWAQLWMEASSVAREACCRGWKEIPQEATMEIYTDDGLLN